MPGFAEDLGATGFAINEPHLDYMTLPGPPFPSPSVVTPRDRPIVQRSG